MPSSALLCRGEDCAEPPVPADVEIELSKASSVAETVFPSGFTASGVVGRACRGVGMPLLMRSKAISAAACARPSRNLATLILIEHGRLFGAIATSKETSSPPGLQEGKT